MLETGIYVILSVLAVSAVSLVGVITIPFKSSQLKQTLHYLVSFAAGALFGDAFLHLLPEAVETYGFGAGLSLAVLAGIVFSFITEKFIRWNHCHHPTTEDHPHPFAYMNLAGDAVHNFLDGIIIGSSYLASVPVGMATTLAVIFHEIPQEIGDFAVLIHGGFSRGKALFLNFLTALTAVAGALLALFLGTLTDQLTRWIIPFAAGAFIYIAGSDLIPELHKEDNVSNSAIELLAFVAGVGVMLALTLTP